MLSSGGLELKACRKCGGDVEFLLDSDAGEYTKCVQCSKVTYLTAMSHWQAEMETAKRRRKTTATNSVRPDQFADIRLGRGKYA